MRKIALIIVTCLGALTPAAALPSYAEAYVANGHLLEAFQVEGAETEVNLFAFGGREFAPGYVGDYVTDGCIELFRANVYEIACGPSVGEPSTLLAAGLSGDLASEVYDYDPHTIGFTYRGPGRLQVDVTFVGDGAPRVAEPEGTGVGVCGLPPDIPTGTFVLLHAPAERPAMLTGSMVSDTFGEIDLSQIQGRITAATFAVAGACL